MNSPAWNSLHLEPHDQNESKDRLEDKTLEREMELAEALISTGANKEITEVWFLPSWELTYPLKSQCWVDDVPNFPFGGIC